MKTVFRSVLALGVAALLFSSCEKDVVSSEVKIDESKMGTVVLHVGAPLNLKQMGETGIMQSVPTGVQAIFTATDMTAFGLPASATPKVVVVDIAGAETEVKLPTTEKGVEWSVRMADFTHVQTQADGSTSDSGMQNTPYLKKYKATVNNITLQLNDRQVVKVVYSAEDVQPGK